jgi:predicted metal-dependent HD superfamily phosphohydrolase
MLIPPHPASGLHQRFIAWALRFGANPEEAEALWHHLDVLYGEPHRRYHNLRHIASSLGELDGCGMDLPLIEGAIWFHDVIYDPRRSDNEQASIEWFVRSTLPWLEPSSRSAISALITVTDFRSPPTDDPDAWLMVDIVLAILSAAPDEYDAYCLSIQKEYRHVADEAFREGRAKVMSSFLANPIYRTPGFTPREDRARENIARELVRLGAATV